MSHLQTLQLDGNALDVVVLKNGHIIVSIDNVHEPNTTRVLRDKDKEKPGKLLSAFEFTCNAEDPIWKPALAPVIDTISQHDFETMIAPEDGKKNGLADTLYPMENLRKRVQGDME